MKLGKDDIWTMDYRKQFQFWLDNEYFDEETKKELLAIRNDELGDAERTAHDLEEKLKEAQDVISGHNVDMLQSESKFRDLEDKYNNLLDNYEKIKQQAQMPVKKQLKYEDLIALPFVGQAVLKQIIPFLESKGIVIIK